MKGFMTDVIGHRQNASNVRAYVFLQWLRLSESLINGYFSQTLPLRQISVPMLRCFKATATSTSPLP